MTMWSDRRFLDLAGVEHPIVQAPMAGYATPELIAAVGRAGGLGSLGCAMAGVDQVCTDVLRVRQQTDRPINVNFFCHVPPKPDAERERAWRERLRPYYAELGIGTDAAGSGARPTFDPALCELMVEMKPRLVSFHFGLPEARLVARLKDAGCRIMSSATTVEEARWLEAHGADAIIAQGLEAGGHRGIFLGDDLSTQTGTMALVPQIVDAVRVPVVAAGGITDGRGIAAALCLGAAAVQIGTAYLFCPEAAVPPPHRAALHEAARNTTALTNVLTGRPARSLTNRLMREVGPMSDAAPAFPLAAAAVAPLRAAAEAKGSPDFTSLWAGQAAPLGRAMDAAALTATLADEARALLR
jgi:nitronate monooxygenase